MSDIPNPPPPPASAPPPPPSGFGGDGGGYGESIAVSPRIPWEERSQRGFVEALVETVKLLVKEPGEAFSRLRQDGDYVHPILFWLIVTWIGLFFSSLWGLFMNSAMLSMMSGLGDGAMEGMLAGGLGGGIGFIANIILGPIFYLIGLFIAAGIYHLCLMAVGGLADSRIGFEGTAKVVAYGGVASLANVVPIIGGLVAGVGALILAVIGFQKVHGTSQGKAILAVLIPIILCCVCAVLFGASMAAMIGAAAAGGG